MKNQRGLVRNSYLSKKKKTFIIRKAKDHDMETNKRKIKE
jgi:hypothetical protein